MKIGQSFFQSKNEFRESFHLPASIYFTDFYHPVIELIQLTYQGQHPEAMEEMLTIW